MNILECQYCGWEIDDPKLYELTEEHFEQKACWNCYNNRTCRSCKYFHETVRQCPSERCYRCCNCEHASDCPRHKSCNCNHGVSG